MVQDRRALTPHCTLLFSSGLLSIFSADRDGTERPRSEGLVHTGRLRHRSNAVHQRSPSSNLRLRRIHKKVRSVSLPCCAPSLGLVSLVLIFNPFMASTHLSAFLKVSVYLLKAQQLVEKHTLCCCFAVTIGPSSALRTSHPFQSAKKRRLFRKWLVLKFFPVLCCFALYFEFLVI